MDAVLSVSDFTRVEVYSFGECLAPGLEAHQHLPQCQLWLEDCRLWASTNTIRNRLHDRVCCNQVVQSSRTAIELFSIHCSYRYLVCRMYIYGVAQSGSTVSRQRLCATASSHHGGTQNATFTDNWINSSAIFLSWFSNEKTSYSPKVHLIEFELLLDGMANVASPICARSRSYFFYQEWRNAYRGTRSHHPSSKSHSRLFFTFPTLYRFGSMFWTSMRRLRSLLSFGIRLLSNLFLFLNEIEFDVTLSVYYMGCL